MSFVTCTAVTSADVRSAGLAVHGAQRGAAQPVVALAQVHVQDLPNPCRRVGGKWDMHIEKCDW